MTRIPTLCTVLSSRSTELEHPLGRSTTLSPGGSETMVSSKQDSKSQCGFGTPTIAILPGSSSVRTLTTCCVRVTT
eukprot:3556797-Rhodomonas_salina.1